MTHKITFTQVPSIWHRLAIIDEKIDRAHENGDYAELERLDKIHTQLVNESMGV